MARPPVKKGQYFKLKNHASVVLVATETARFD